MPRNPGGEDLNLSRMAPPSTAPQILAAIGRCRRFREVRERPLFDSSTGCNRVGNRLSQRSKAPAHRNGRNRGSPPAGVGQLRPSTDSGSPTFLRRLTVANRHHRCADAAGHLDEVDPCGGLLPAEPRPRHHHPNNDERWCSGAKDDLSQIASVAHQAMRLRGLVE